MADENFKDKDYPLARNKEEADMLRKMNSRIDVNGIEPNSHKYNQEKEVKEALRPKTIVKGKVVKKKRGLFDRFKDTFVKANPKDVRETIWTDVIYPAIIDNIFDILTNAYNMMFRGESVARRKNNNGNSLGGRTNYGNFFLGDRREKAPTYRRSDIAHNFDQLYFESRAEAENVLDAMVEIANSDYKQVTVADFYDLVGITGEHTDNKFGWRELGSAKVKGDARNGYYIDLPRCISLD